MSAINKLTRAFSMASNQEPSLEDENEILHVNNANRNPQQNGNYCGASNFRENSLIWDCGVTTDVLENVTKVNGTGRLILYL